MGHQTSPAKTVTDLGNRIAADGPVANGARDTVEDLFRRYYDTLIRFLAWRLGGDRDRAADIAQETYLRVVKYSESPEADGEGHAVQDHRAFLFRVARNVLTDEFRKDQVRKNVVPLKPTDSEVIAVVPCPEQILAAKEELASLRSTILKLPPRCREVFFLSRYEDLSNTAVAQRLGISVSMVEKHLSRAMRDICAASRRARDTLAPEGKTRAHV